MSSVFYVQNFLSYMEEVVSQRNVAPSLGKL